MAIEVSCPACQAEFKVKDEHAGKRGRCPRCKGSINVPAPGMTAPVVEAPQAQADEPDEYALADSPRKPRSVPLRASADGQGVAAAARSAAAPSRPSRSPGEILDAFGDEIEPVRPTLLYRLWVTIVAGVMVLLPLLYLAIIGLVGYGIYYHAVHHLAIFKHVHSGWIAALLYVSPIVGGAAIVLFMLKPLFARPGKRARPKVLDPSKEPLIFAFVDGICAATGARRPRRIEVDCDVNAAAGLDGGLLAWARGDLYLVIGLPLVAGLSLRQFAGVLAHEFGHFSQRGGIGVSFLVRYINHWFARLVYERDAWDETLRDWSHSKNDVLIFVAALARLAVWITRWVLWAIMLLGHVVSSFLARQMEFDADRYEARMVGGEVFEETMHRMIELNLAQQGALQDVASSWKERRLPDNYPKLVLANVAQIPDDVRKTVMEARLEASTGLFDTHPADKDRIARALEEDTDGIVQLDGPATDLFRDFDSLALAGSLAHYRALTGEKVTNDQLYPVAEAVDRAVVEQQGYKALRRFLLSAAGEFPRLPLPPDYPRAAGDLKDARRSLIAARTAMQKARGVYQKAQSAWTERENEWMLADTALVLLKAGARIKASQYGLDENSPEEAEWASSEAEAECAKLADASRPFEAAAANRLIAALGLLEADPVATRVPDGPARREEARFLYPYATHFAVRVLPELTATHRASRVLERVFQKFQEGESQILATACLRAGRQLQERLHALQRAIGTTLVYPFEHAHGDITLGDYALPAVPHHEALGDLHSAAESAHDAMMSLCYRVLGCLAVTAEEVERVVGLVPIAAPVDAEPVPS